MKKIYNSFFFMVGLVTNKKHLPAYLMLTLLLAFQASIANATENAKTDSIKTQSEAFLAGFYVYTYQLRALASSLGLDYPDYLDSFFSKLTKDGFKLFYVTAGSNIDDLLSLSEKYDFKMILQLEFAYLTSPSIEEATKKAPSAISFIKKYKQHPNVLGFSIKEEPSTAYVEPIQEYYRLIRESVSDASLFLLLSDGGTIGQFSKQPPSMLGSDRYAFWGWDSSAGGYSATPAFALNWYRNELDKYAQYARTLNVPFTAVFTSFANVRTIPKSEILNGRFGDSDRILQLAASNNQGWALLDNDRVKYTKYYRPPVNCTKAMVWLSIFNGSKSVMHWSGTPTEPSVMSEIKQGVFVPPTENQTKDYWLKILASNLDSTPAYLEFSEVVKELNELAWIINRMQAGGDVPEITLSDSKVIKRAFKLDNYQGYVLLLVNSDVGTWDSNSIASLVKSNEIFRIDNNGELTSYSPYQAKKRVTMKGPSSAQLWDIKTGTDYGNAGAGSTAVEIEPGGGVFLFVGEQSELQKLRQDSGIDISVKIPAPKIK